MKNMGFTSNGTFFGYNAVNSGCGRESASMLLKIFNVLIDVLIKNKRLNG